jgi:hypothetical protein
VFRVITILILALLICSPAVRADEAIRLAQEELRKRNLFHGDIDGRETPAFLEAVKRYQQRKGFAPTGVVDADTLRSMGVSEPAVSELPSVPVLRSDRSSAGPLPGPFFGRPHAATASAAATIERPPRSSLPPPSLAEVRKFIRAYLDACQSPDVADELAFYGDRVDYFHHGTVDKAFISGLLTSYYAQWPQREYRVGDSIRLGESGNYATARCRISFNLRALLGRTASGKTDNTFTFARRDDNSLEIIGHQEERVRSTARRRSSRQRGEERLTPLDRTLRKFFGSGKSSSKSRKRR